MENLEMLLHGLPSRSPCALTLMVIGVLLGILVACCRPGAPNGVSLLLPLTFGMQPVSAIILLSSIVLGRAVRGSVTSILFKHTGRAVVGRHDVRRLSMARDGRRRPHLRRRSLGGLGALVGVILITFLASWVAQVALRFRTGGVFRGLFPRLRQLCRHGRRGADQDRRRLGLGFAIAAVGIDTVSGSVRLTMASTNGEGSQLVVAVMGLFGIGELLIASRRSLRRAQFRRRSSGGRLSGVGRSAAVCVALLRSAAIGCWMGITPGGPTAASFMSYASPSVSAQTAIALVPASPKVSSRRKLPITPPAPARFCRCFHSAFPVPRRSRDDGRIDDLGIEPGADAVRRSERFRLGLIASMYVGNIVAVVLCCSPFPCRRPDAYPLS